MKVKAVKDFFWNEKSIKSGDVEETQENIAKSLEQQGYVIIVAASNKVEKTEMQAAR